MTVRSGHGAKQQYIAGHLGSTEQYSTVLKVAEAFKLGAACRVQGAEVGKQHGNAVQ